MGVRPSTSVAVCQIFQTFISLFFSSFWPLLIPNMTRAFQGKEIYMWLLFLLANIGIKISITAISIWKYCFPLQIISKQRILQWCKRKYLKKNNLSPRHFSIYSMSRNGINAYIKLVITFSNLAETGNNLKERLVKP